MSQTKQFHCSYFPTKKKRTYASDLSDCGFVFYTRCVSISVSVCICVCNSQRSFMWVCLQGTKRNPTISWVSLLKFNIPAPSKGWCLNPKELFSGTPYHPFGTPWRVQVCFWWFGGSPISETSLWSLWILELVDCTFETAPSTVLTFLLVLWPPFVYETN